MERRAKLRQRVLRAGTIEFDGNSIDCVVRNISATGAALDVSSRLGIPHEVTLNFVTSHERHIFSLFGANKGASA
jgi:PilZ domain